MGVAASLAPKGFGPQDPTKKLAHRVKLLGQPLSQKNVFENLGPEPPPSPLKGYKESFKKPRLREFGLVSTRFFLGCLSKINEPEQLYRILWNSIRYF